MEDYEDFLKTKQKSFIDCGFEPKELNKHLFPFQKHIVAIACRKGRFALFEDCGLGKTIQFLSWAEQVVMNTKKPVLILSPLAIVAQTISEGSKFGIEVKNFDCNDSCHKNAIYIINYEQLKNIDASIFSGIVFR